MRFVRLSLGLEFSIAANIKLASLGFCHESSLRILGYGGNAVNTGKRSFNLRSDLFNSTQRQSIGNCKYYEA